MKVIKAQFATYVLTMCSALGACTEPPIALGEIAKDQARPGRIVVDSDHIYWVSFGITTNGSVMRLAKSGGDPQVLATAQSSPLGLVVDDEAVYWTNAGADGEGAVIRLAKAGGQPVALVTGLSSPGELAADEDHLYWTSKSAGVERIAKLGGHAETLVSANAVSVGIAVDEDSVYFGNLLAGEIQSVAKTGGAVTTLASTSLKEIPGMQLEGNTLFWHDGNTDSLMQMPTTGGTPAALYAASYEMAYFAVTPTTLFVAHLGQPLGVPPGPGSIRQFDRASRTDKSITPPVAGNWGIAVDARTVYWTNNFRGTVNAVARPEPEDELARDPR